MERTVETELNRIFSNSYQWIRINLYYTFMDEMVQVTYRTDKLPYYMKRLFKDTLMYESMYKNKILNSTKSYNVVFDINYIEYICTYNQINKSLEKIYKSKVLAPYSEDKDLVKMIRILKRSKYYILDSIIRLDLKCLFSSNRVFLERPLKDVYC